MGLSKRLLEGNALIRRLVCIDLPRMKLDYVLALKVEDFLERRLQTQVFKLGLSKRLLEGNALIRRLVRIDVPRMKLDYVLALKVEDFLERRLQTQVFKLGLAKSVHHARVLITQTYAVISVAVKQGQLKGI